MTGSGSSRLNLDRRVPRRLVYQRRYPVPRHDGPGCRWPVRMLHHRPSGSGHSRGSALPVGDGGIEGVGEQLPSRPAQREGEHDHLRRPCLRQPLRRDLEMLRPRAGHQHHRDSRFLRGLPHPFYGAHVLQVSALIPGIGAVQVQQVIVTRTVLQVGFKRFYRRRRRAVQRHFYRQRLQRAQGLGCNALGRNRT